MDAHRRAAFERESIYNLYIEYYMLVYIYGSIPHICVVYTYRFVNGRLYGAVWFVNIIAFIA